MSKISRHTLLDTPTTYCLLFSRWLDKIVFLPPEPPISSEKFQQYVCGTVIACTLETLWCTSRDLIDCLGFTRHYVDSLPD